MAQAKRLSAEVTTKMNTSASHGSKRKSTRTTKSSVDGQFLVENLTKQELKGIKNNIRSLIDDEELSIEMVSHDIEKIERRESKKY